MLSLSLMKVKERGFSAYNLELRFAGDSQQASYGAGEDQYLKMLMNVIPGIPGQDYPIFGEIPSTSFSCQGRVFGGFYADTSTDCQVKQIHEYHQSV